MGVKRITTRVNYPGSGPKGPYYWKGPLIDADLDNIIKPANKMIDVDLATIADFANGKTSPLEIHDFFAGAVHDTPVTSFAGTSPNVYPKGSIGCKVFHLPAGLVLPNMVTVTIKARANTFVNSVTTMVLACSNALISGSGALSASLGGITFCTLASVQIRAADTVVTATATITKEQLGYGGAGNSYENTRLFFFPEVGDDANRPHDISVSAYIGQALQ